MSCGKPEDEDGEMPARRVQARSGKCVKCRVKDIEFAKMAAGYCKECFVIVLGRRFKEVAYLAREHCRAQKGSQDRTNASLLLAYSGSAASRTTLELLKSLYFPDGVENSRTQSAFSRLEILYVQAPSDTDDTIEQHWQTVAEYGFELTTLGLDEVFEGSQAVVDITSPDLHTSRVSTEATSLLENKTFTSTSHQTLSSTILASFIVHYAEQKGHKAVIFCESSTKLAAKTLAAISKGQGWNLGELVGGSGVPIDGSNVRVYRPLSVISDDEVRFFASEVRGWPVDTSIASRGGIDGLVGGFVKNLEAGFPSTVSVISRTASKLGMRSVDSTEQQSFCALCRLPRDPETRSWRPVASLSSLSDTQIPLKGTDATTTDNFAASLCYGCLVPFMELQGPGKKVALQASDPASTVKLLPAYVKGVARSGAVQSPATEDRSMNLRSQIEDFLL